MALSANSDAVTYAKAANTRTAAETGDRIEWVKLSLAFLPLATPVSDAKVLDRSPETFDRSGNHHCRNPQSRWL
ncbi:racemase [Salmonella enterica subsp. enterica]|nr:racemase [Salmonella enterica subsp. enterica]